MQTKWSTLAALALFGSANAHSWVEMMNVIAPNGTFTGAPGFARGNCQRGPKVDPDKCMVHLLPPNGGPQGNKILDSDPMCMPSQQSQTQSQDSPRLQAAPGSLVALRFQENGHVTLPDTQKGKPANRGTVYIYGTTEPDQNAKFLQIHKVWNADGTGGDKKGKLLATQNYDDGQCYQKNQGPISTARQAQFSHEAARPMGADLWCQNDIALPSDAPSGKPYTLYWVWDWPTAPNVDPGQPKGLTEIYTTCMDVDITGNAGTQGKDASSIKFVSGQSLNNAAVPSYMSALAQGSGNIASTAQVSGTPATTQGSSTLAPQAPAPTPVQPSSAPAPAANPQGSSPPAPSVASVPQVTPPNAPTSAAAGPATVTVTASAAPVTVTVGAGTPPAGVAFTGTASAVPASSAAAAFQCNNCKMQRRSKIFGATA